MQSEGNANHFASIGLNFGMTVLCIPFTWIVLSELDHAHEIKVTEIQVTADDTNGKQQGDSVPSV